MESVQFQVRDVEMDSASLLVLKFVLDNLESVSQYLEKGENISVQTN